jgi:hypothetical protein
MGHGSQIPVVVQMSPRVRGNVRAYLALKTRKHVAFFGFLESPIRASIHVLSCAWATD